MATELFKSQGVDTPIHPGEILGEEIEVRELTVRELALQMRRPARGLAEIVSGRRSLTAEWALDLERALGISARFWMNLQSAYELDVARLKRERQSA